MGISRSDLFSAKQNRLADLFKALAHPARIAIIQHILKSDSCINGELVKELGLAQATISQHLNILKEVGLIKGEVSGNSLCYCLNKALWKRYSLELTALLQTIENSPSC